MTFLADEPLVVRRPDRTCAVRGCDQLAAQRRVTLVDGTEIFYCDEHELVACDLFDRLPRLPGVARSWEGCQR